MNQQISARFAWAKSWRSAQVLRTLVLSSLLFCQMLSAAAADWDTILKSRGSGDWAAAFHELRLLAEGGDTQAQLELAEAYLRGEGTEKSETEAVRWIQMAAEQGNALAQLRLGLALREGLVVERNHGEAIQWFRLSANQGNPIAQLVLGRSYVFGWGGLEQDLQDGARLLRLAAEQGQADAQLEVGTMYMNGHGVEKNVKEGATWISRSALQLNPDAYFPLAEIFRKGTGHRQNFVQAKSWMQRAAWDGDARAMRHLGLMHLEGKILVVQGAAYWFTNAIEAGNWRAAFNLGEMFELGVEVPKDYVKAASYYQIAADNGDERAISHLAKLRESGLIPTAK